MVDKLHFREVGPHKNEIGFYHNESGPLTVYVSRYDDGSEADSGFQNMSGKIMEDQQVFIMGKYLMIRGRRVFRCFGLGQTHFIFTHGRNLIWMSVNTIRAMNIIEAYLNNIG